MQNDPLIEIVGLGPGPEEFLTLETIEKMRNNDFIFLRTKKHPLVRNLKNLGISDFNSFDYFYEKEDSFEMVYKKIKDKLIIEANNKGKIVYAVPGNPLVAESTVGLLIEEENKGNVKISISPAVSFLDVIFTSLNLDPNEGICIIDGLSIGKQNPQNSSYNLITQVYDKLIASEIKLKLMDFYPSEHNIQIVKRAGIKNEEEIINIKLYQLDRFEVDYLTTICIPPLSIKKKESFTIKDLENIMKTLRGDKGCPWDKKQNHRTLKQYLIEEAYEVIEMIDKDDKDGLEDELGDLLLQVVFHAQIGNEEGYFDLDSIISKISNKMIRRHPHIYHKAEANTPKQVIKNWEDIKKEEKGFISHTKVMKEVPNNLPALMKANKVQKKAALVGFDWNKVDDAFEKVIEECYELKEVYKSNESGKIKEELGDILFAVVNVSRFLNIDPEEALRGTIEKFINRFSYIEENTIKNGKNIKEMSLQEMDNLWNEVKNKDF